MTEIKTEPADTKSEKDADESVDVRVIKALGHPLRQRILQELNQGVASPSEIASQLNEPLSNVSYHVKILAKCDAIELVRTSPVRGALEHFYRATMRARLEEKEWASLPDSIKHEITGQTLTQIGNHVTEVVGKGGFDDPKAAVVWVPLQLDEEAHERLGDEMVRVLNLATDLEAESAVRLAKLDEAERAEALHKVEMALLYFHRD